MHHFLKRPDTGARHPRQTTDAAANITRCVGELLVVCQLDRNDFPLACSVICLSDTLVNMTIHEGPFHSEEKLTPYPHNESKPEVRVDHFLHRV